MAPNGPQTSSDTEQRLDPSKIVRYIPGPGTGETIYQTADGRYWKKYTGGTTGCIRRPINGYMQ